MLWPRLEISSARKLPKGYEMTPDVTLPQTQKGSLTPQDAFITDHGSTPSIYPDPCTGNRSPFRVAQQSRENCKQHIFSSNVALVILLRTY